MEKLTKKLKRLSPGFLMLVEIAAIASDAALAQNSLVLATDSDLVSWVFAILAALALFFSAEAVGEAKLEGKREARYLWMAAGFVAIFAITALRACFGMGSSTSQSGVATYLASGDDDWESFLTAAVVCIIMCAVFLVCCRLSYGRKLAERERLESELEALGDPLFDLSWNTSLLNAQYHASRSRINAEAKAAGQRALEHALAIVSTNGNSFIVDDIIDEISKPSEES